VLAALLDQRPGSPQAKH
jgi:hypothetical protein